MNDSLKTNWIINGLLAVILVLLVGNYVTHFSASTANAAGTWDANGVMVLAYTGDTERLVLVDTNKQNIMVYHARQGGGFGLVGARSYKYDIEVEDLEKRGGGNNQPWTYLKAKEEYEKSKKP